MYTQTNKTREISLAETYARVGLGNLRAINRLEQSLQAAAHPCAMSPNTIIYQSQRYNTHSETALGKSANLSSSMFENLDDPD